MINKNIKLNVSGFVVDKNLGDYHLYKDCLTLNNNIKGVKNKNVD
jgi:hypothetical protein